MKKTILASILTLILSTNVLAGDQYHQIMSGSQDSLVLGKVTNVSLNKIILEVTKTISGKEIASNIGFQNNKDFSRFKLKKGDYILSSIERLGSFGKNYNVKWGFFKVNSLDYKTLKIIPQDASNATLGWFINSGQKKYDGKNIFKNLSEYHGFLLWNFLHTDLQKHLKASLVLGTITNIKKVKKSLELTLNLKSVLKGHKIAKKELKVFVDYFSGACYEPKIKDNVLISVQERDGKYIFEGDEHLFKLSSLELKNLKIKDSCFKAETPYVKALEWYLHSNLKENDFYFPDGKLVVKKADNTFKQID